MLEACAAQVTSTTQSSLSWGESCRAPPGPKSHASHERHKGIVSQHVPSPRGSLETVWEKAVGGALLLCPSGTLTRCPAPAWTPALLPRLGPDCEGVSENDSISMAASTGDALPHLAPNAGDDPSRPLPSTGNAPFGPMHSTGDALVSPAPSAGNAPSSPAPRATTHRCTCRT